MSWDIFAMDFPRDVKSVKDMPDDYEPGPIGKRSEIIASILEVAPSADFSDPCLGKLDGDGWGMDISTGHDEICSCVTFHVYGGGDAAIMVSAILTKLNLRAVETGTGDFFIAGDEAAESFQRWQRYRDQNCQQQ